ncbi:hypothetical protein ACIGBL_04335 [Streptomyces sp. NPDC085614]|uniref:hypothetical protein n=1 Tax=Streptomyces sp. NPDC085614 TaxID=3365733 RepID=UPI0037D6F72E
MTAAPPRSAPVGAARGPRRAAPAAALALTLLLTAAAPGAGALPGGSAAPPVRASAGAADCDADPASCRGPDWLYQYTYGLGFHPFTSPHAVREQLTDNFWLFPVSGACPRRIHADATCSLLGGNPVRVEIVGYDFLQIVTLPGHALGAGQHIRFAFAGHLGTLYLMVSAWQNRPGSCTGERLCGVLNRVGAWTLWRVLAATLGLSAYVA